MPVKMAAGSVAIEIGSQPMEAGSSDPAYTRHDRTPGLKTRPPSVTIARYTHAGL